MGRSFYRTLIDRLDSGFSLVWWTLWLFGAFFLVYALFFKASMFFRNNAYFIEEIAARSSEVAILFFIMLDLPIVIFPCLLTSHITLAVYKRNSRLRQS
jgi:hypothetical protein